MSAHGDTATGPAAPGGHHAGHGWRMLICCIPMIVIVGALVATGVLGPGLLIFAALCVGLMALMMAAMSGDHPDHVAHENTARDHPTPSHPPPSHPTPDRRAR
ncbi:MAG: hypothetical protein HYX32_09605 [Actinobacteria bacterium]|nr:hypothetical protein [Actinomycetota bacterium]